MLDRSSKRASAARKSGTLDVLDREPGVFAFSAWQNVTIFVWQDGATIEAVRRLAEVTEPVYATYPEGVSNVHVIDARVPLPDNAVRDELTALMRTRAEQRGCIGVVLDGGGFWASALRSLITGMRVLTPRSFELRIMSSSEEIARWLPSPHFKKTGRHIDSESLRGAIEETRALVADLKPPQVAHAGE